MLLLFPTIQMSQQQQTDHSSIRNSIDISSDSIRTRSESRGSSSCSRSSSRSSNVLERITSSIRSIFSNGSISSRTVSDTIGHFLFYVFLLGNWWSNADRRQILHKGRKEIMQKNWTSREHNQCASRNESMIRVYFSSNFNE